MIARHCTVPTCSRPHLARGWCRAHYLRWQRGGDPRANVPVTVRGSSSRRALLRRVTAERGPAAVRPCATCGAPGWCWSAAADVADPALFEPVCRSCLRHASGHAAVVDVERAARLYQAGVTARGIAAVLRVGPGAVRRALRAHGVALRPGGRTQRRTPRQTLESASLSPTDLDATDTDHRPRRPSPRPRPTTTEDTTKSQNNSQEPTTQRHKNDDQTIAS